MVKFIENNYTNIVAFNFEGEITKDDFENVIVPKIEQQIEAIDEINLVYVLNTDLSNFSTGAWWEDAMLGLKNLTKWNKSAIVTDNDTIAKFTEVFSKVMPGEFKAFPKNELEDGMKWAST